MNIAKNNLGRLTNHILSSKRKCIGNYSCRVGCYWIDFWIFSKYRKMFPGKNNFSEKSSKLINGGGGWNRYSRAPIGQMPIMECSWP